MKSKVLLKALCYALILMALVAPTAMAAKPGPGTSQGSGRVFFPNPVAALQDQSLTVQKDADYPALQPAYQIATRFTVKAEATSRTGLKRIILLVNDKEVKSC